MEYSADPKRCQTDAAIRAGYDPENAKFTASCLMKHVEVQEEIQRRLKSIVEKLGVNAEMVLYGIIDGIEQAKRCGPGAWQRAAVLRGYKLLGRALGMFIEKVDFTADEKIIALLAAGRRRAAGLADDEELPGR